MIKKWIRGPKLKRKMREKRLFCYSSEQNRDCKKVYMSTRAYSTILAETLARDPLETGGILLGHYSKGEFYVIESTDPGMDGIHTRIRLEFDNRYHNHIYSCISRLYNKELHLVGLWHRHPGSYDSFSKLDDGTNIAYAKAIGSGCISLLVNCDREKPRLSGYYLDANTRCYHKVEIEVTDRPIEEKGLMEFADFEILNERKERMKEELMRLKGGGHEENIV